MSEAFVPASRLYNVESRTPIAHPATQATDEQVRRALEQREVRADGGRDMSSSGTEQQFYRCKECLNDPDKRISAAARFRLEAADDYAEVLRHALREHPDSDELADILDFEYATPCARCEDVFLTRLRLTGEGLIVRNFCDECAEDGVETLIHRSVGVAEVLPVLAPAKCEVQTDSDRNGGEQA